MDECECLNEIEEKLKSSDTMSEDRDPEELQEVICESIPTQDSLKQDNVENSEDMAPSNQLSLGEILHKSEKLMDLELQLEKEGVLRGPDVEPPMSEADNLGQLPGQCVEFADLEEIQVQILFLEEDSKPEQELDIPLEEVQTKSWWCQQANRLWKAIKFAGNFCLGVLRCLGLRRCLRQVVRSNQVLPL